ncbi:MAG: hypothetical protein WC243_04405, partial [Patescibacteria group bacterium]
MARRGRKKKFRLNLKFDMRPDVVKSILAIIFVLLGGLSALAILAPEYSLNGKVQTILKDFFGGAYLLLPFILFFIGVLFIDVLRLKMKNIRILIGLLVLQISLVSLMELFGADGGKLGERISELVVSAVSKPGAVFIFVLFALASVILISHVSINQVLSFFGKSLESAKKNLPAVGLGSKVTKKDDEESREEEAHSAMDKREEAKSKSDFEVLAPLS